MQFEFGLHLFHLSNFLPHWLYDYFYSKYEPFIEAVFHTSNSDSQKVSSLVHTDS